MNNRLFLPQVSYRLAYILSTVVMTGVWMGVLAIIGLGFGTAMAAPMVSILQAQITMAVTLPFVALFSGQGVLTTFLDGYAKGAFVVEPTVENRPEAKPANPWLCGLTLGFVLGVPWSLAWVLAIPLLYSNSAGLTPGQLTSLLVPAGSVLATFVTLWICGRVFRREIAVPISNRRYPLSPNNYVWRRIILPNALANLVINAWVAAAIFPGNRPHGAPLGFLLTDISITAFLIFIFVSGGACNHVVSDRRWGLIADATETASGAWFSRVASPLLCTAASAALAWVFFSAAHIAHLGLETFVIWKAISACVIAAVAARIGAIWGLATKL
ncbi:MAG: hypothetical protein JXA30_01620 [Deltaproteobacteria bacterium]|nr:hypothetical protein [Deltaproteobacteria bacterium]